MSTILSKAMRKAGVTTTPANKRIWDWLKDNGEHTGAEVSAALNIPLAASSSIISQMKARKMLNVKSKHSEHLGRNVGYYSAAGRNFEVLPMPKKGDNKRVKAGDVVSANGALPTNQSKLRPSEMIANLSVGDAFEMYKTLDGMFNRNIK